MVCSLFVSASTNCDLHRPAIAARVRFVAWLLGVVFLMMPAGFAQSRTIAVTQRYLNVPVGRASEMRVFQIAVDGEQRREFPVQLAEGKPDYWIFLDVSEFKGKTITLSGEAGPDANADAKAGAGASQAALDKIYQSDKIEGEATLYRERNRPLFHFTVKRGWSNDVNGPIFYKGQYHLFWQAFPFGDRWDTGFMYWGHAVSKDLVHWRELPAALMLDRLGSPWSGSSFVDHDNAGGWGKDALVLAYTAFDRVTKKQVQCIAYSTDGGATFTRYAGNPVIDTNDEVGSKDTRDPHVFWYAPGKHWVMVLFEKDGMSIFNSADLKAWTRKSHFKGLAECPDLFELPVDGDRRRMKWVLHGGSSSYYVGSFDGERFTAETGELRYAEGKNAHGDDALYASQSFAEMPDGRRVQMAWGRIEPEGMPFNQMMLFPTEFKLVSTKDGVRLRTTPVAEIARLQGVKPVGSSLSVAEANRRLAAAGPAHVKLEIALGSGEQFDVRYAGRTLATVTAAELAGGRGEVEVLVDKCVAEVFVDHGARYVVAELPAGDGRLELAVTGEKQDGVVQRLEVDSMRSMWR
jgi:sucrose-6-phosphate hydrolase SacC (GH32 family)